MKESNKRLEKRIEKPPQLATESIKLTSQSSQNRTQKLVSATDQLV